MFRGLKRKLNSSRYNTVDELSDRIKCDLISIFDKKGINIKEVVTDIGNDSLKLKLSFRDDPYLTTQDF